MLSVAGQRKQPEHERRRRSADVSAALPSHQGSSRREPNVPESGRALGRLRRARVGEIDKKALKETEIRIRYITRAVVCSDWGPAKGQLRDSFAIAPRKIVVGGQHHAREAADAWGQHASTGRVRPHACFTARESPGVLVAAHAAPDAQGVSAA